MVRSCKDWNEYKIFVVDLFKNVDMISKEIFPWSLQLLMCHFNLCSRSFDSTFLVFEGSFMNL